MRTEKKIHAAVYIPAHVETIKYYEFSELSKDIQERLIEEKRKDIQNDEFFWDYIFHDNFKDDALYNIEEKFPGIMNKDLCYSLNCCQGDGVSFTGEVVGPENITALLSLVYDGNIPRKVKRVIPYVYSIQFNRDPYIRYCHEYSVNTCVVDNYNDWSHDRFQKVLETMEKAIDVYRAKICKDLEIEGYNLQDYYTGREYIIEELSQNEYFEDGEAA